MAKSKKELLILLFLIILPSLVIAGFSAQSTKPSPPQFTISRHDSSTIWITIDNQPFNTSSTVNAIEYYYRVKDHSGQLWVEDRDYVLQSDTQTAIIPVELDTMPYKLHSKISAVLTFKCRQ